MKQLYCICGEKLPDSDDDVAAAADDITIQLNSILYYLCAESTATRPITDTAQCRYK
jgi:hypothetical protein